MKYAALMVPFLMVLTSCEEEKDPALTKKHEEQQMILDKMNEEYTKLNQEIDLKYVLDPSSDLQKIEAELEVVESKNQELTTQLESLVAEKKKKMEKLEEYQKDYLIRSK